MPGLFRHRLGGLDQLDVGAFEIKTSAPCTARLAVAFGSLFATRETCVSDLEDRCRGKSDAKGSWGWISHGREDG